MSIDKILAGEDVRGVMEASSDLDRLMKSLSPSGRTVLKNVTIGDQVKVLRGRRKGDTGEVIDLSIPDDQVDVEFPDKKVQFVGFDDVQIVK